MAGNRNKRAVTMSIVLLFLFLFIIPYFFYKHYSAWCADLVTPVLNSINVFTAETKETASAVFNIRNILREREEQSREIQKLKRDLNNVQEIYIENQKFKKLLEFKDSLAFEKVAARVIARDAIDWYHSITVSKGTVDGVMVDMPVISFGGIVGKVIEVSEHTAKVILLSDKYSKVGGIVQDTRYAGVVEGSQSNNCVMKYILKDAEIKEGDVVVSSGFGGVYPKGLKIGEVINVMQEQYGLYKSVTIKPSGDLNRLEEVLIIVKQ